MISKTDLGMILLDSGFNLWNEKYLIIGVETKFGIYNLFKEQFTQDIQIDEDIYYFKIIIHSKFGKCIIYVGNNKIIHLLLSYD